MPQIKIKLLPWKGYPLQHSGLESSMDCIAMESQRVRHSWTTFTWSSQGKNTEVVCHSLLQWIMFCQSERKSVLKDWCWSWNSNPLATWCEELTHWKRPWCWERLKAGGEGDDGGERVGWHHRLDWYESDQALGVGDGRGNLACCSPWGHKESDTTEWLNWTHGVGRLQTKRIMRGIYIMLGETPFPCLFYTLKPFSI